MYDTEPVSQSPEVDTVYENLRMQQHAFQLCAGDAS